MPDYSRELIQYAADIAGASADVSIQPADNCHTIIILNTSTTDAALVGIVANSTALTTANAALLPAGASLPWPIGGAKHRPFGSFGATTRVLRVAAVTNTPIVTFQFLNGKSDEAQR